MSSCTTPAGWQTLVDWWAGDLDAPQASALEEHLLGCDACSAAASRVAATAEALRTMIPPVVPPRKLRQLAESGMRIVENTLTPGAIHELHFPRNVDLMVLVLGGLSLRPGARVDVTLRTEGSGDVVGQFENAPFDADRGAVLLACQRDYADFEHEIIAEVAVREALQRDRVTRYTIHHHFQ